MCMYLPAESFLLLLDVVCPCDDRLFSRYQINHGGIREERQTKPQFLENLVKYSYRRQPLTYNWF